MWRLSGITCWLLIVFNWCSVISAFCLMFTMRTLTENFIIISLHLHQQKLFAISNTIVRNEANLNRGSKIMIVMSTQLWAKI